MRRVNLLAAGLLLGSLVFAGVQASPLQGVQAPIFEVDPLWPKPMPNRWILGSAVGVAVDSRDHVYVIHLTDSFNARTEIGLATNPPTGECCAPAPNVLEFDPAGNLVGHWGGPGQGYDWPETNHGIAIDQQDNVWIGGSGGSDTRLLKFTRDGKFVAQFGKKVAPPAPAVAPASPDTAYGGVAPARGAGRGGRGGRGGRASAPALPPNSNDNEAFGGVAKISIDPSANEAYVADGFRNHRVAVIDMTSGAIKRYWGAYGNRPDDAALPPYTPGATAPQQFANPVRCAEPSKDGMVYVCDRNNDRIQVFKKDGAFVKEKTIAPDTRGDGSVWDIAFSRDPQQRFMYVADGQNMKVYILDRQTLEVLTSFGDGGRQPGQFFAVHSLATDSKGNIYTTETLEGKRVQKFVYKGIGRVTSKNRGVLWPAPASGRSSR